MRKQHFDLSGLTQGSLHTSKNTLNVPQGHSKTLQEIHFCLWCALGTPQGRPGVPEDHLRDSLTTSPDTPEIFRALR